MKSLLSRLQQYARILKGYEKLIADSQLQNPKFWSNYPRNAALMYYDKYLRIERAYKEEKQKFNQIIRG